MRNLLLATLPLFTSKEIVWSAGADVAEFEPSFIDKTVGDGPNLAYPYIDFLTVHGSFVISNATALLLGEDIPRFIKDITIEQVDDEKRFSTVKGDSLRNISYAVLGVERTHEHQDVAIGAAGVTIKVSVTIPLAKPFAYDPRDNSLPAWALKSIRVKMAEAANLSINGNAVTITSGKYWVTANCHAEKAVVQKGVDCWYEHDFDTSDVGEILLGGRLKDVFLMIAGANGGLTLANLDTVQVENVHRKAMYKDPTFKVNYARLRGGAYNSFASKGSPLRTDPFAASDTGTLRALAPVLSMGDKCFDGPELQRATVRVTTTAALPGTLRIIARAQKKKTQRMREFILDTFDVDRSNVKTSLKSKKSPGMWAPEQEAYLPTKFFKSGQAGLPRYRR